MAQTINTNVMSLTAQRNLGKSQSSMTTSINRLSSGLRVNSAKDDAAGLAIAERMNSQVRGMNVAIRNANDGISYAQTAEGGLNEMGNMLQRMRELAVQAANGTNSTGDKANLNAEFTELGAEVQRIVNSTEFNGKALFTSTADVTFQVGANNHANQTLKISATDLTGTGAAGLADVYAPAFTIDAAGDPNAAMDTLDAAIDKVTTTRAAFGATQSRFESAIANLQINSENTAAARGRIMDADFAIESANLSRTQILQQAGTAMVSQANAAPQGVLRLLG